MLQIMRENYGVVVPLRGIAVALVLLTACLWQSAALAVIEIEVTQGGENAVPIAVVPFGAPTEAAAPVDIAAIVAADLQRSGRFAPLNRDDLVATPVSGDIPRYANWRLTGSDYLVIGSVAPRDDRYAVQFQLFDVLQQRLVTGFSYTVAERNLRGVAHQIADEIFEAVLGIPGAFNTQIAFVSVEGSGRDRTYKLQLADSDGFAPQTMLSSPRPIMSPAWAPDGVRIAYVSFEDRENSAIYVQDREQGVRQKLLSFAGINGAPAWSPDGTRLAVTLSHEGDPDIYVVDVDSGDARPITDSRAIETEPVWLDDETVAFTSDRSGGPQIYEVSASGGRASRLTFEGSYNASADVSPDGSTLAFVHRGRDGYQIATLDRETDLFRTLTDGSLDESPSFAPNGQMILYATEGSVFGQLGAVSLDGSVEQSITLDSGSVREPSWSPYVR